MSAKGGITEGKSHKEGGIPMVVKSTGQQVELEGGEGVINKRNMASTKTFDFEGKKMTICEIASKINSADGNGVQIDCDNVTGTKYKYAEGGQILNEDEESEFKIWFEDGNVIEFEKGVYSTQDAQYSNKLKGMDELRKYFRKEFLSDNYQYSEGGNVNQELKMDYDFRSLLLPNEKQFFLQDDTKAIQHNNLFIFTDGKREIVFSRHKTKLKKLGNASKSTKELYDKYFADGGYVDLETYNFNELRGKYVNLYTMGVELPTEHQIVDITLTSPQFRYRYLTLKFDLGNAKIKFEDIEDFFNEKIVFDKTDKEEFGVKLIPNQFAQGGKTANTMKLEDYETASMSMGGYEDGAINANPTEFAKGGEVDNDKCISDIVLMVNKIKPTKDFYIHNRELVIVFETEITIFDLEQFNNVLDKMTECHKITDSEFRIGYGEKFKTIILDLNTDDFILTYAKGGVIEQNNSKIGRYVLIYDWKWNELKEEIPKYTQIPPNYIEKAQHKEWLNSLKEKADDWVVAKQTKDGKTQVESSPYTMRYMYSPSLDKLREQTEGEWYGYGSVSDTFAKGGFVVYAENQDGYYRKISEHDTMRGAKTKMNNIFDLGEYEKVDAISSEEWEKNYAPYQFKDGGGVDSIKIGDEIYARWNDSMQWTYGTFKGETKNGFEVYDRTIQKPEYIEYYAQISKLPYPYGREKIYYSENFKDRNYKNYHFNKKYAKGGDIDLPKANKMFHLPLELAVYVPSTQDVNKVISDSELKERVDEVSEYLARLFGGFTKSDKIGGFMASNSELVTEDVVPVVSFATKSDFNANKEKLVNKLSEWAKRWGQEAIGFEFEGDLYYVPEKFANGGNINKENYGKMTNHKYANGGGIMADGRIVLRTFNGVGGNKNKTYKLIKDDRDSDGKPFYTLIEEPSGNVMAQGDSFDEVNGYANLMSGKFADGGGVDGEKVFEAQEDGILGVYSGSDAYTIEISKGDRFKTFGKQDNGNWWFVKKIDIKPTSMMLENTFDYRESKEHLNVDWQDLVLTFPKGENSIYAEMKEVFANGGDVRDMSWYQDFKKQELKRGTEHEMEHIESIKKFKKKGVSDREVAKAIAKDHLDENENYYIELDKMKESSAKVSNALQDFDHQKSKRKNSRKYKLGGYMGNNEPVNVHIKLNKDHDAIVRSKDGTYLNDVNLKKNKIYKFGFLFDEGQNVAFDLGNGSDSYILIPSSIVVVVGYDEEKMELGGEVKSYAEYQLDRNDKSILKLLLKIDPFSATAEQRDKVSTFKGNNRVNDLSPKLIQKIYGILFKNHNIDNQIKNLYLTNIGAGNILLYAPNYLEKTIVGFDEKNEFVQVEKEISNIVTLGKRATLFNEFELSDIDGFIHVYSKSNPEVDNLCEIFYKSNKKAVAVGVCEFTSREKLDAFQRSITINQGSMALNQVITFAKSNDYLIVNEGITSEGQYTLIYTMTKY